MIGPVELDYYACDLRTGIILEELHSLVPSGTLGQTLGTSTTGQFDLTIEGAPPAWIEATEPGRSLIVAVDRATGQPIWPGIILTRDRGTDPTSAIGCVTPEGYFDRRYTGDYAAVVDTDQALIMTGLGTALAVDAPCFVFDAPLIGTLGTYSVADSDDRTILSTWQELMAAEGGPEWTVGVEWADTARTTFQLPIIIRARIGDQSPMPEGVFDLPGCIASYKQSESYESGSGATEVQAYGDGQGASRLKSAVHTATDLIAAGWPLWAYRWTPAQSSTDPVALDAQATQALTQMDTGASTWTVSAVASQAPRVGSAWGLGDTIRILVTPNTSPGHPDGVDVVARCWAWTLDPNGNIVSPILVEDDS